jgi:hypothetical protein
MIEDADDISIVMLALPPWSQKSADPVKVAMMSGFFCAACDVRDDEAQALWSAAVKDQGLKVTPMKAGRASNWKVMYFGNSGNSMLYWSRVASGMLPMAPPRGFPKPPGSGRKKGSKNKLSARSVKQIAEELVQQKLDAEQAQLDGALAELTPLQYCLDAMRDPSNPPGFRLECAKASLPYVHAKMAETPGDKVTQITEIRRIIVSPRETEVDEQGNATVVSEGRYSNGEPLEAGVIYEGCLLLPGTPAPTPIPPAEMDEPSAFDRIAAAFTELYEIEPKRTRHLLEQLRGVSVETLERLFRA